MRVLLVDDNEELREFLALCLSEASIEVVESADAVGALQRAEGEKFDAYVIDSVLENGDGLSLVSELRNLKNGRAVPILLMSSISTSLARRMAQTAGCTEFLVKPFGQMQFLEQVKALEKRR
ncbi:two-component system, chemotaxis family, response regulator CheY [Abditibacterium utsteinense]|uniref:Two-component system, chemotaxis family, response regulator CheY n=1 Tax=Abditibacterium utsteinense TaxID=1960156 RepID=A0A2S8SSL7_9BACT|nr:response regulator [Abditibacterium utsteinense]PQV63729.1 two-component system, chemotaxis family, response regulator CheY [Abditibacterium utsteinense]